MDLEDLRTFVEVAEAGGVAPGARRLGLAKSIVSRRLARLEESIGAQLLARTARGSMLTEAGATFREHAMRVVSELDAARETLGADGDVRGLLRISAPLSFGVTRLTPVFAELALRHPALQLEASFSDRFVDIVGEGFDCALRLGFLADSSLLARRICTFRGRLVASHAYIATHGMPRTLEELAHHEIVMKKGEMWQFKDRGKTVVIRPRSRFLVDNGEAVLVAALAGVGIAALPDFLIESRVEQGHLIALLTEFPTPDAGMFVVRPPGAYLPRKVKVLIDILIERFGGTDRGTLDR